MVAASGALRCQLSCGGNLSPLSSANHAFAAPRCCSSAKLTEWLTLALSPINCPSWPGRDFFRRVGFLRPSSKLCLIGRTSVVGLPNHGADVMVLARRFFCRRSGSVGRAFSPLACDWVMRGCWACVQSHHAWWPRRLCARCIGAPRDILATPRTTHPWLKEAFSKEQLLCLSARHVPRRRLNLASLAFLRGPFLPSTRSRPCKSIGGARGALI